MSTVLKRILFGVALAVVATGCSYLTPPDANRLVLSLSPTNELGYEIDSTGGITVSSRTMQLSTRPGMPLTTVTGYRIDYFNTSGSRIGMSPPNPQSLNVVVPAGFVCESPEPTIGCNALSEGARPAPGIPATAAGVSSQLLSADIATMHVLAGSPAGWYAEMTLYYDNAWGQFEEVYALHIVAPN